MWKMEKLSVEIQSTVNVTNISTPNDDYDYSKLPIHMRFNEGHRLFIIITSILMVFSAISNTTILIWIVKRRKRVPSRINTMLMHLAIADLLVTFLMMPLEIAWNYTVSWWAGDLTCRIMMFFRMFGLFLSSFVLVCLSIDRFYAVVKPFAMRKQNLRGKTMLAGAWILAFLCSIPQTLVFHVEPHPKYTWYKQCVALNPVPTYELAYFLFGFIMMYALPFAIVVASYAAIITEICKRTKNPYKDSVTRSSLGFLSKAKIKTLKMTIIIVLVFFLCWGPYYVMCTWYWIDKPTALKLDPRIEKGLFLFACTNSCVNPIVYGIFNVRAQMIRLKVGPGTRSTTLQDYSISRRIERKTPSGLDLT